MSDPASAVTLQAVLQPWVGVAEPLHKRIGHLVDPEPTQEVLWIGAGATRSVLWWASRFDCHVVGIDPHQRSAEKAGAAARAAGLADRATFQSAPATDLPFEAGVFDIVVSNSLFLAGGSHEDAVREVARVARPMASVVVLAPTWLNEPGPGDGAALARLGIVPRLIVEWKATFRDTDVVDLSVEEAAADGAWLAPGWLGLILRAWRAAGWRGLAQVFSRDFRLLRRLALTRTVSLSIMKGTRWQQE